MAYQILGNVNQPYMRQGDQLLHFTQSVIKMEKKISQITSEVFNPMSLPEGLPYPPERRGVRFDGENIDSKTIAVRTRSVQNAKSAESAMFAEDSRPKRLASISREPAFKSVAETGGIFQHSLGPRSHMKELREGIMWTPSKTSQTCKGNFKTPDCNITLARVYFAQGSEKNSDQVPANGYNRVISDSENFESPKQQINIVADRQKNGFMNNIIISSRRQSAPSLLNSPVAKPSPLTGGIFQNPQPARGSRKPEDTHSSSEEYIYFLPEYQESRRKPLNRDAILSKSSSVSNACLPPLKRSKPEQEEPETIVIPDKNEVPVSTKQCGDKESNFLQVVTDSEGRICVNVTKLASTKRPDVKATIPIIDYEEHRSLMTNQGGLERTLSESSNRKEYFEINEYPSNATEFENKTTETWNTSALITNDHRWDSWKRANCIPSDGFDPKTRFNCHTNHPYYRTVQFCEGELDIIGFPDENNNDNSSEVETPHLNKFIQTSRHFVPDNSMCSHAKAANQNFIQRCDQATQREICTERSYNTPKENCSGKYQSLSKNDKRCVRIDRQDAHCQKTQRSEYHNINSKGPLLGVSNRRTSCGHNFRNRRTQRCSFQALKKDSGCKCSNEFETGLTEETTVVKDNCKDKPSTNLPGNQDKHVRSSCSAPSSKSSFSKISSNETLSLQPTTKKEKSGNGLGKDTKTRKDNDPSKETLTKSSRVQVDSRYECDWPACDKSFRHYSFLVLHKRIHTGERPYLCSWEGCSKQFRRSDDYQRHYRVHTGAKPYVCVFCGKAFKRSDHRLFHYRAIHHVRDPDKRKKKKK